MSSDLSHRENPALKEAKIKASRYCAYQERTQQQVRTKLLDYGLKWDEAEEVLADLITEGFINEERFAKSFAGGRFRLKKWGRLKIERELQARGLTEYCIRQGMKEIEEDDYRATAMELLERKLSGLAGDPLTKRAKLTRYLAHKGYEYDLINSLLSELKLD